MLTKTSSSPAWSTAGRVYRAYRSLPPFARVPFRALAKPRLTAVELIARLTGGRRVAGGPFAGLELLRSPKTPPGFLGYLAGTYECELAHLIERLAARGYRTVVNVGAADGYYAVGLARRLPTARIVAFEGDTTLHRHLRRMAARNGVGDRIDLHGWCDREDLAQAIDAAASPTLLVVDVEGGEVGLLDPEHLPTLRRTDILVEVHENFSPGCMRLLLDRFSQTHHIEQVRGRTRTLEDLPPKAFQLVRRLSPATLAELLDEKRGVSQDWLFFSSKDGSTANGGPVGSD